MEEVMVERVKSSLGQFNHRNALFLCERLCAQFPSEINLQLLATCYLRNNQAYAAYHILKGAKLPQSRYLFAISCYQMNLLKEAESALSPANEPNAEVPNGAAGHHLLGLIYRYTGRRSVAIEQFTLALSLDPLLWTAYEELCTLGAAEEASVCFNDASASPIRQAYLSESTNQKTGTANSNFGNVSGRDAKSEMHIRAHSGTANSVLCNSLGQYDTPSPTVSHISGIGIAAPPPLCRNGLINLNNNNALDSKSNPTATNQVHRRKYVDEAKLRKVSERLFDSGTRRSMRHSREASANSNAYTNHLANTNNSSSRLFGGYSTSKSLSALRTVTLRRGLNRTTENHIDEGRRHEVYEEMWVPPSDHLTNNSNNSSSSCSCSTSAGLTDSRCTEQDKTESSAVSAHNSKLLSGVKEILSLLRIIGEAYRLACSYRCQEAIEMYQKLSEQQFNTGWVLCQVGKAYFELLEYTESDRFFELARRISPYTLEGMDIHSTVLYHLKEEMRLSYLAHELISIDRLSPQAWCAVGNCYSLQKDHETALKNFQRAVQLDPRFAYAHTLLGHEHSALEDFESAIRSYQSALQADERHYNSWYGLGVVYLRQDKFEFAEHNFRTAYRINSRSSILMCYLGMALHSLKRNGEALEMMERAILADRKNPLPSYQKARVLVSLERYDLALDELDRLKEILPRESSVYALMGKIYKQINVNDKAMFYFGLALDMKPPPADAATIKSAMEKLALPDEIEDPYSPPTQMEDVHI